MDDSDKQTTEGAHVFTFLTKNDNDTFGGLNLSDRTTTETNAENKLIDALGSDFLSNGVISQDGVGEKIEIIKHAFEDAGGSDEELIEALVYNDHALACFLLTIAINSEEIEQTQQFEDTAARCLAFGGDIHFSLWTDLCSTPDRLYLVLQASKKAAARIAALVSSIPDSPAVNSNGYLGYDERDRVDFDNEGYEDGDKTHLEEQKAAIQEKIDVWFLLLHQIFAQPVPQLSKKIVASRARKNSRYSSRRMAKLKDTSSTESAADISSTTSEIDTMDLVAYFTDLVGVLLELLGRHRLSEDAHNVCVKVVACVNSQMPRLQHADTNEVAAAFAAADSGETGENLSQGLLYLLNENGFPHIHSSETLASIRLCRDLLNVEKPEELDGEEGVSMHSNYARGHFYTNDVKVMVDIIVRELCNIPHNTSGIVNLTDIDNYNNCSGITGASQRDKRTSSRAETIAHVLHGTVRYAYLELLDAIVNKSSWTSSGDCYMKEQLKTQLEEILAREGDEKSRAFATDLLSKYDYYLS